MRSKHAVDPALMNLWLERYRELGVRLKAQPDGEWAWLWRVRRDILYYLLHRYGRDVTLDELPARSLEDHRVARHHSESVSSYLNQSLGPAAGRGATRPPRERSDFRTRLDHLRSVNDRVREEFSPPADRFAGIDPWVWIVRKLHPEETFGAKEYVRFLEQRAVVQAELEGIRACMIENGHIDAAEAPLTDDQIMAILSVLSTDPGLTDSPGNVTPEKEASRCMAPFSI